MHRTYGCSKNPRRTRPLCDLCGRKFCQPQKLKVHMKRMHSDLTQVLKDFQCKICLKLLGSTAALQRHMREVHRKDYGGRCTCERCGKSFQNKSNLKIHMLVHSGVKPFKCQEADCSAAFTTKQCLQFHYKKTHGLSDELLPKIERSVAYTFDAYSGGACGETIHHSQQQCGLDLTAVIPTPQSDEGRSEEMSVEVEETSRDEVEKSDEADVFSNMKCEDSPLSLIDVEDKPDPKTIVSKGSKKWLGHSDQNVFRRDGSNASLLVEAAISAAEKDQDISADALSMSSIQSREGDLLQQVEKERSVSPDHYFQFLSKKDQEIRVDSKEESVEYYKRLTDTEKNSPSNIFVNNNLDLGLSFKYIALPRLSTALLNEMQKDAYHLNVLKDIEENEYRGEKDEELRSRDVESYRADVDTFRYSDEFSYRSDREDNNFDREFDIDYRGLEKTIGYRVNESYRSSSPIEKREELPQEEGEAQNLCLKGKLDLTYKNYDSLEDFARTGKDAGLESLLAVDNQRVHATMLSPRYHPTYDSESVDLSVPRATYPTSPIYTLDLTPGRLDLQSARHFELRNHIGLPSNRFTSRSSNPASPPPPCYPVYQSPYMSSPGRSTVHLSPTPQFPHYTGYY